jgi:hypothetical protein
VCGGGWGWGGVLLLDSRGLCIDSLFSKGSVKHGTSFSCKVRPDEDATYQYGGEERESFQQYSLHICRMTQKFVTS